MNIKRYQRHFSILGLNGQKLLENSSILIIGCGGIGCPVSLYLAAAGVGKIGLIDDDYIDESNLQRQILYTETDIGKKKVHVAQERLNALNSDINITQYDFRLTFKDAVKIFKDYDLIIDGTDNFPTRYLVNDACCVLGKTFISASVLKNQAQLALFNITNGCLRCVYPEAPPPLLVPNCAEAGVLGSAVGVIGSMAASMAINYIAHDHDYSGTLKLIDCLNISHKDIEYTKNHACHSCVNKKYTPINIELYNNAVVKDIPLNKMPAQAILLDVREEWERSLKKLDDHLHIPKSRILDNIMHIPKDKPIVCYCKSGIRSKNVALLLREYGYDVYSLEGGIDQYQSSLE